VRAAVRQVTQRPEGETTEGLLTFLRLLRPSRKALLRKIQPQVLQLAEAAQFCLDTVEWKSPAQSRKVAFGFFATAAAYIAANAGVEAGVPVKKAFLYVVTLNLFTGRTIPARFLAGFAKWTLRATPYENICPSDDMCRDSVPPADWNSAHSKSRTQRRGRRGYASSSRSTSDLASEFGDYM